MFIVILLLFLLNEPHQTSKEIPLLEQNNLHINLY